MILSKIIQSFRFTPINTQWICIIKILWTFFNWKSNRNNWLYTIWYSYVFVWLWTFPFYVKLIKAFWTFRIFELVNLTKKFVKNYWIISCLLKLIYKTFNCQKPSLKLHLAVFNKYFFLLSLIILNKSSCYSLFSCKFVFLLLIYKSTFLNCVI